MKDTSGRTGQATSNDGGGQGFGSGQGRGSSTLRFLLILFWSDLFCKRHIGVFKKELSTLPEKGTRQKRMWQPLISSVVISWKQKLLLMTHSLRKNNLPLAT